ncbi:hypothetical protein, partial [[Clostridium] symbiosum]
LFIQVNYMHRRPDVNAFKKFLIKKDGENSGNFKKCFTSFQKWYIVMTIKFHVKAVKETLF